MSDPKALALMGVAALALAAFGYWQIAAAIGFVFALFFLLMPSASDRQRHHDRDSQDDGQDGQHTDEHAPR